ncbi:MAG: MAPEG family protein [Myxococcales bacterium]|nr:MAPEG family protein [Myxococcales bacterium]
MKPELFWLALTATMTALFWVPYVLNRLGRIGLPAALATPRMDAPPAEAEWAQRARRAHANATENLAVFTALVAVAQFAGISNGVTATGAALYFWGRLAHYLAYRFGIPYARTLSFTLAWIGIILIAWQVLFR